MFKSLRSAAAKLNPYATPASLLLLGTMSFAAEGDLPDTGVDVGAYVASLTTSLGGTIGLAIAAGFAIFALILGVKYVKRLIKG